MIHTLQTIAANRISANVTSSTPVPSQERHRPVPWHMLKGDWSCDCLDSMDYGLSCLNKLVINPIPQMSTPDKSGDRGLTHRDEHGNGDGQWPLREFQAFFSSQSAQC